MAQETYILDASIAMKWFTDESDTKEALDLLEKLETQTIVLIAPDLIYYETANALRWNKNFTKQDTVKAINALYDIPIVVQLPTNELIEQAIIMAYEYGYTIYDSIYVALSKHKNAKLITSDKKILDTYENSIDLKHLFKQ